jgi:hypothetical protein
MMIKKIKETPRHKKHEQKGKTTIIGFLPPKVLGKWFYVKWSRDGHLKQLGTMNHNFAPTFNNHIELMW